jgi:hypothetical protein
VCDRADDGSLSVLADSLDGISPAFVIASPAHVTIEITSAPRNVAPKPVELEPRSMAPAIQITMARVIALTTSRNSPERQDHERQAE